MRRIKYNLPFTIYNLAGALAFICVITPPGGGKGGGAFPWGRTG